MRSKLFATVAGLLAALLLAAGAVYVYDGSRSDLLAEGVTVNGVSVGGMKASQARVVLRRALLEPLEQPVVVRHGDRRFKLTAEQARIGVDVDGSVDRAIDASRSGSLVERAWRGVTGGRVERDVAAEVTYSKRAVSRLVRKVDRALARAPQDASVDIGPAGVSAVPSRKGREVRASRLRRDITRRLLATSGGKTVRARTRPVRPEVSTSELADRYPAILVVNRGAFTLSLYKNLKLAKTYGIAVGQAGMDTPAGEYTIQNKAENPAWHVPTSDWAGELAGQVIAPDDPRNPIKARWMGIYDGVGVHGTDAVDSIGSAASHGCIRMIPAEVIELYDQVPVGAPIYIA
jgi:lipoprotein-anchoring transpeptidase ErfK/SrfK